MTATQNQIRMYCSSGYARVMNNCRLVAVLSHCRIGLKMNDRRPRKTARRKIVVATVSTELNGLEKRFSFIHSRGGSFEISGGAATGTFAIGT
ncbi:MAG: hypothetical protein CM1200mP26_20120 [Acidimicrobiales bacterium]|nr:MAG: hypothetical protein CM1200mP26_20120 [Acidimicrobiales bacterium]